MTDRQRILKPDSSPENCKSLFPEIADLLNVSVSVLERYPADIQKALSEIYTDNYHADNISTIQALGKVVQLNSETEKQLEQAKQGVPKQDTENQKRTSQVLLTREQILRSAKMIAETNRETAYRQQAHFAEKEQIDRRYKNAND